MISVYSDDHFEISYDPSVSVEESNGNVPSPQAVITKLCRDVLEEILRKVEAYAGVLRLEPSSIDMILFGVRMGLEEALMNAAKHGNKFDPKKKISVESHIGDSELVVTVRDEGEGFSPEKFAYDPTAPENLERTSGRGLLLMREFMNTAEWRDGGRTVLLSKAIVD